MRRCMVMPRKLCERKRLENLPVLPSENDGRPDGNGNSYHVSVENLHFRANDIDAIRRLAEVSPELASEFLASSERADIRQNRSMALGMITAGAVALALIGAACTSVIFLGWWQSIVMVCVILGCSHLLRVLLKGEWSDTSWFGKILGGSQMPPK